MNTYAKRKDANQSVIVEALRAIGATVKVMHTPLDLLVGYRGRNFLLEVKRARSKTSKGRGTLAQLTPAQIKFVDEWRGQYAKVYTADEAIEVVTS